MRRVAAAGLVALLAACHASTGANEVPADAAVLDAAAAAPAPDAAPPPQACASGDSTPGVCPGRGLYDRPVTVRLSAPASASIMYTLDGSEPAPTHGTRYERPFEVAGRPGAGVVVLQAVLVQEGTALARPVVHSYVFPEQVLTQPREPPGAPLVWGSKATTPAAYELDPAGYAADRAAAVAGLRALPTVSVVLPPADLWNPETGIYMNPEDNAPTSVKRASVEWFTPDGQQGFQIEGTVDTQGGASQTMWKSPKLSLKLEFHAQGAAKSLAFPLFADSKLAKFTTLILDAHYNYTWIHWDETQRRLGLPVRDPYASDLQRAVGSTAVHDQFVHLYLDGLYWGVYDLHERPDDKFAAAYLGGSDQDYDSLKHDRMFFRTGDPVAWDRMFALARAGLADAANYQAFRQLLDVDDFILYMLVQFYIENVDWDASNWYAARNRVAPGGFHFFNWDGEQSLIARDLNVTTFDPAVSTGKPRELWAALRMQPDFVARLQKQADALMTGDGALTPASAQALFDRRIGEIRPAMPLEAARWGRYRRPEQPYGMADFDAEVARLRTTWFPGRTQIVREQVRQ